ncbi:hypothetical protein F1559_000768 [Cyanidiococcus yangmingshanensis]|uniref:Glucose-6-phosphate 1-epimerase n=1 Tax=Cyanidiococcus yangmingshanensis TaxID=2690220 RepID=A0A7J7IDL9_9RHOD|nr:hypothetical protein F1559_000768 [Cyanidiococcus yangmingshanensis]
MGICCAAETSRASPGRDGTRYAMQSLALSRSGRSRYQMDHKLAVNISKDPIQEVQEQYGVPGRLTFFRGRGGLEMVLLQTAAGACAEVSFFGAQVLSWQPPRTANSLLFVSREAIFDRRRAVRGGIPVCWPQFSKYGPLVQQHGYARNTNWELVYADGDHPDGPLVVFELPTLSPSVIAKLLVPSPVAAPTGAATASSTTWTTRVFPRARPQSPGHQAMSSEHGASADWNQENEKRSSGVPDQCDILANTSGMASAAGRCTTIASVPEESTETTAAVTLTPRTTSPVFESELQHAQVRLMVQLGAERGDLRLRLEVWNRSPSDADVLEFTTALHAYLRVDAVTEIRITGLSGCEFIDQTRQQRIEVDQEPSLTLQGGEVDRIYRRKPQTSDLIQVERVNAQQGTIRIEASTDDFPELVIWNPGPQKSHELVDLDDQEWMFMACVEPAVIIEPVRLHRDERWCGHVTFTYVAAAKTSAATKRLSMCALHDRGGGWCTCGYCSRPSPSIRCSMSVAMQRMIISSVRCA